MRRHCDHNRLHWKDHCGQQKGFWTWHQCCKVSLVARWSSTLVVVSKSCVASWSGWFRAALFRAPRLSLTLTLCGKRSHEAKTLIFVVIIPHTSFHGVCHCLIVGSEYIARSNAISSNKTLPVFSAKFAFRIFLCVWNSMVIQQTKIAYKKSKSTKFSLRRRPTATAADKARQIRIEFATSFAMNCG